MFCFVSHKYVNSQGNISYHRYLFCLMFSAVDNFFSQCFLKVQESREVGKTNQQKSQSPAIQVVTRSPKMGQLKHHYQEGKCPAPVSMELTNGEPERTGYGNMKSEQDLVPSASGEQELLSVAFLLQNTLFHYGWEKQLGLLAQSKVCIFFVPLRCIHAIIRYRLQYYNH